MTSRYCKYRETDKDLFKLQTQIRAELNILRSTYKRISSKSPTTTQKKHFPQLYTQTHINTIDHSNSHLQYAHQGQRRGKKSISPIHIPQKNSLSPSQRRHCPKSYHDNIVIDFPSRRSPSVYLERKQLTPEKSKRKHTNIMEKNQRGYRPGKRMNTSYHLYDNNFWR